MEEWRQIKDFPDYAVSNFGRVKRIVDSKNGKRAGLIRRLANGRGGYMTIMLTNEEGRRLKMVNVLVIEAFGPPRPSSDHECHHKDSVRNNNNIENLEWFTKPENISHAVAIGNKVGIKGEKSNLSRLKNGEVWLIKKILVEGKSIAKTTIAKMFKVHVRTIFRIQAGEVWSHIAYP